MHESSNDHDLCFMLAGCTEPESTDSTDSTPASNNSTPASKNSTPASNNSTPASNNSTPASNNSTPASNNSTPAAPPQSESMGGVWRNGNRLSFDGRMRSYSLYTPSNGKVRGLMVVLHGSGDTVENIISEISVESTADENGLIIAVPAGVDNGWNDEDPAGGESPTTSVSLTPSSLKSKPPTLRYRLTKSLLTAFPTVVA